MGFPRFSRTTRATPELIAGELSLREVLDFHAQSICLDECTDKVHDDTCLVGLSKRVVALLDMLETPGFLTQPQAGRVLEMLRPKEGESG